MDDGMERKRLLGYLPSFMQQFEEMKEITKAEDALFDELQIKLQNVLDSGFIMHCDEAGIKKYESILNIIPSPEDTLESRKSRVLLRWNEYVPYTFRVLEKRLNAFCGVNKYDIINDLEHYLLQIHTSLKLFGQVTELENMCDRIIPANIMTAIINQMLQEIKGPVFMGAAAVANRQRIIN